MLKLIENFLELATVRLKLTATARAVPINTFELIYLVLQLFQLSSLIFVKAVLLFGRQVTTDLLLLTYHLLLDLSTSLLACNLPRLGSYPLHMVLFVPLDQIDTFKYISDVIDTTLLDAERVLSRVQVKALLMTRAKQLNELVR